MYRGKFIEENMYANGSTPYFKTLSSNADVTLKVYLPFFDGCPAQNVNVDSYGIFEFNMSILNASIPYTMRLEGNKPNFEKIVSDYFVGGYPISDKVEMGSFMFYKKDNNSHDVLGRIFDAFTNKTLSTDYTISVYQGLGEYNRSSWTPYERLDFYGNGEYYTGYFQLYDLKAGSYVAVVESEGYIKNF